MLCSPKSDARLKSLQIRAVFGKCSKSRISADLHHTSITTFHSVFIVALPGKGVMDFIFSHRLQRFSQIIFSTHVASNLTTRFMQQHRFWSPTSWLNSTDFPTTLALSLSVVHWHLWHPAAKLAGHKSVALHVSAWKNLCLYAICGANILTSLQMSDKPFLLAEGVFNVLRLKSSKEELQTIYIRQSSELCKLKPILQFLHYIQGKIAAKC